MLNDRGSTIRGESLNDMVINVAQQLLFKAEGFSVYTAAKQEMFQVP